MKSDSTYSFLQAKKLMAVQIEKLDLKCKPLIYRIEIKIKPLDPIAWVEVQQSAVKIYGANQEDTSAIAGIGEAFCVKGAQLISFKKVFTQLRQYLTPQYPYMQWYGGFCFDDKRADQEWSQFGTYRFVLPRFELARNQDKMIFCCNLIGDIKEPGRKAILKELDAIVVSLKNKTDRLVVKRRRDIPNIDKWLANATAVLKGIAQQKYAKIVLARKTILSFTKPINPFAIFKQLRLVTPNSYHFCFNFGSSTFLGASPERLYKRQGRMISSEAIAGTIRRGGSKDEDDDFKSNLKASLKDNHEHRFVVDAINEHLTPLCKSLNHEHHPQVISLGNGHHLMTPFIGEVNAGVRDEDVLQSLHPTPAVAGTPSSKALPFISHVEEFSRGWYAGPLGYVGLDWAEFVVGIRSGLIKGKTLSVFAGAGIVHGSNPQSEWEEIENKISNFIKVVK